MESEEEKNEGARQKLLSQTQEQYQRFYRIIQIQKGDSIPIVLGKILLTMVGTLLMIVFSPVIIFVLIFAFLAAF